MYDDDWSKYDLPSWFDRPLLRNNGRLTQLVFLDGRLVDSWTSDVEGTRYHELAREYDAEKRPPAPPAPPRHQQVLEWLDSLVGGRSALLAMEVDPGPVPDLREVLDPAGDEQWLVVGELLDDLCESLLPSGLVGPLRHGLLLAREEDSALAATRGVARVAAGLAWLVGKANGALGAGGAVRHKDVAERLGLTGALNTDGQFLRSRVARPTWSVSETHAPWRWQQFTGQLLPVGRAELLEVRVREEVTRMRDDALAEQIGVLPTEVAS